MNMILLIFCILPCQATALLLLTSRAPETQFPKAADTAAMITDSDLTCAGC